MMIMKMMIVMMTVMMVISIRVVLVNDDDEDDEGPFKDSYSQHNLPLITLVVYEYWENVTHAYTRNTDK